MSRELTGRAMTHTPGSGVVPDAPPRSCPETEPPAGNWTLTCPMVRPGTTVTRPLRCIPARLLCEIHNSAVIVYRPADRPLKVKSPDLRVKLTASESSARSSAITQAPRTGRCDGLVITPVIEPPFVSAASMPVTVCPCFTAIARALAVVSCPGYHCWALPPLR